MKPTAPPGRSSAVRCWRCGASSGLPANAGLDPLASWRDWAPDLRGSAVESGHYLPEENAAATAQALLEFFGADRAHRAMTELDRQSAFSGTRDVAERLRFDAGRLEDYLRDALPGFAGPIVVSQFKGGQSNPTYLVETPLRRYVLRRKPPGKLLPSAHAVDREYRVISALYRARFSGRRAAALLRRRERHRHGVLRHGLCRGPRVLGAADAGVRSGRARAGL